MSKQMIVRINPELKSKVANFAKSEGKNISEVVRELLEEYVKDRDISGYIDDLWERIGNKLKDRKVDTATIQQAIREVRSVKK